MSLYIGLPLSKPRILIPHASARIQAHSFILYNPSSNYGKTLKLFAQASASTGFLYIIGRLFAKPISSFKSSEATRYILDEKIITYLLNDWRSVLKKENIVVAISLGNQVHYQKVTTLLLDNNSKPLALAKVGYTPQSKSLLKNETTALQKIKLLNCTSFFSPSLISHGDTEKTSWLLQSPIIAGIQSRNILQTEHIVFLSEITQKTLHVKPLNLFDIWNSVYSILKNKTIPIKSNFKTETLFVEKLRVIFTKLSFNESNNLWPFTITHGDFAPWNMRLVNGKVALYDWEHFLISAPVGWDIIYFIFQVENLIKRQSMEQVWHKFESGAYLDKIMLYEKQSGVTIPDCKLLAVLVILAIMFDLIPKYICREHDS